MTSYNTRGTPRVPTPPRGEEVASYATYLEAQKAVDYLSDKEFAVQNVTIVGSDLQMVERITGRLTYPRVAGAGALSGAWFGIFVGLLLGLVSGNPLLVILPAMAIGAAFGMLFGVVSYSFAGGKRDFTSSSQVVAGRYALLCLPEAAGEARALLSQLPDDQRGQRIVVARPPEPQEPPAYGAHQPPSGTPGPGHDDERVDSGGTRRSADEAPPRYGARIDPSGPSQDQQLYRPEEPR